MITRILQEDFFWIPWDYLWISLSGSY